MRGAVFLPWKMPHSNKVPKCIVGFLPPRPMAPEVASTKPRHGLLLPPCRAALPKSFQNSSEGASNFARPIHNPEYFRTPHRAARPRESILVLPYLHSSVLSFLGTILLLHLTPFPKITNLAIFLTPAAGGLLLCKLNGLPPDARTCCL